MSDTTTIQCITTPQCLTEHSEAFQMHQISVTFFIFGISVIPTLPYCSPLKVLWRIFFPQCSAPIPVFLLVSPHAASVLFVPLHWGVCSCVFAAMQPCARMRVRTMRAFWGCVVISVFTFLVLSSPCDCLSLLMFEVGCQADLHARAHVLGGGGWGCVRVGKGGWWGVWVYPCRIAGTVWVGVCWALLKKKNTHTLFAVACTCECILHAFVGMYGVENPLTGIHTTPGSSMFIILPKRTIKISSVRRNL